MNFSPSIFCPLTLLLKEPNVQRRLHLLYHLKNAIIIIIFIIITRRQNLLLFFLLLFLCFCSMFCFSFQQVFSSDCVFKEKVGIVEYSESESYLEKVFSIFPMLLRSIANTLKQNKSQILCNILEIDSKLCRIKK